MPAPKKPAQKKSQKPAGSKAAKAKAATPGGAKNPKELPKSAEPPYKFKDDVDESEDPWGKKHKYDYPDKVKIF